MAHSIQQIDDAACVDINGGDYVEQGLGLICGIALTAGFFGSGGLLGVAVGFGVMLAIA